jgi:hypothetical protein
MPTPIYKCPVTGQRVQTWIADDGSPDRNGAFESVTCLACRQVHYVDPGTGKVLDHGPFRTCIMKDSVRRKF